MRKLFLLSAAFAAFSLQAAAPKYVFLFIGDGMSTPQRLMAEDFSKRTGRGELAMNHLARRTETATKSARNDWNQFARPRMQIIERPRNVSIEQSRFIT